MAGLLVSHDAKRFRLHTEIRRGDDDSVVATAEHMLLHVDTNVDKAAEIDPAIGARLDQVAADQTAVTRPSQVGRAVGQPRS